MRSIAMLLVLGGFNLSARAGTWYVSNSATNGYALGVDSNDGRSLNSPFRTISRAVKTATAGDVIELNPGGTVYEETTGSVSHLVVDKPLAVQTDPTLLAVGKAVLGSALGAGQLLQLEGDGIVLEDLVLDGNNSPTLSQGVVLQSGVPASITLRRCEFRNVPTGAAFCISMGLTNGNLLLDQCSAASSSAVSAGIPFLAVTPSSPAGSVSLSGCSISGIGGVVRQTDDSSTLKGLAVEQCVFSNCGATAIILSGPQSGILIRSNTLVGSYGLLDVSGVYASNICVIGNSITLTNATTDPISVIGSTGVEIAYNRVLSDALAAHAIIIGTDGYYQLSANSGPDTLSNLGDTAANTWIAQPWTMVPSASYSSRGVASFSVYAKAMGSPTGTISAFLFSDTNGAPAGPLAVSDVRVNAGMLSNKNTRPLEFWFDAPYLATYSASYWIVLTYSGNINGTDYVSLDSNRKGSVLSTSADGASWASGATALIYNVNHGNFECVNPLVHDNYIACSTASARLHCVFLGAITGGQVFRNHVAGGGPLLAAKLVDGSTTPCIFYDNLVFEYSGSQQALRDKGSRGVRFVQNTVIMNGTKGMAVTLDNNYAETSYNGHPSVDAVVENNILYAYSLPGSGVMYQLGAEGYISPTCINPTIDYNLVFARSGLGYYGIDASDPEKSRSYVTWADWQSAGFDLHGINVDPLLSNPSNPLNAIDFTPNIDSPVIGSGADLSAIVPADFFGFSTSLKRSIGAIQAHPPPTMNISPQATELGVNGYLGQTIILQASTDLLQWRGLATNTLSADKWVYTNTTSAESDLEFYRAVVSQ